MWAKQHMNEQKILLQIETVVPIKEVGQIAERSNKM